MKYFTIELSGEWVLDHRGDDVLPMEYICAELGKVGGVSIGTASLTEADVAVGNMDAKTLEKYVSDVIARLYPGENTLTGLTVTETAAPEEGGADGDMRPARENAESVCGQAGEKPAVGEIAAEIEALVGAEEFKALAEEAMLVAPEIEAQNTHALFGGISYLFSIGEGCGLTTYLRLFGGLLHAAGITRGRVPSSDPEELKLPPVRDSYEPFEGVSARLHAGDGKNVKVICIDISEWMNDTDSRYFRRFLRDVEKCSASFVTVFRVPFVDKDVLERLRLSLDDVLCVRSVSFPPLTGGQLRMCAEREFAKYGFRVAKNAWRAFDERMSEEKSDGRFYGLNTVKKVVRELIYRKQVDNARKKKRVVTITRSDVSSRARPCREMTGEKMLNELVGGEEMKKRIAEMIAQIELATKTDERPCLHMRFTGNPGTGKTTVARIVGQILKEKKILSVGNFYEYSGRDLCGRYVGETAPKTASICRDAYGSVLFIDEAYSLYRGEGSNWDYGREAIDTLIAEMENHRGDLVVIMAGYTDDMEKLMESNAGLKSRMPYKIEFPNFTGEQLCEIFASMVNKKFATDDKLAAAARAYFTSIPDDVLKSKEFGNARFVRNLFERTWAKAAMRSQLSGGGVVLTADDFALACADKDFSFDSAKKRRIGFLQ